MKRITLFSILFMLMAIPLCLGQTSFSSGDHIFPTLLRQNGPMQFAPISISHNTSQIANGTQIACAGSSVTDNLIWQEFDLAAFGITNDFTVSSVKIGIGAVATVNPIPLTVNIYSNSGVFPGGTLTLQGTASYSLTNADNLSLLTIPVSATITLGNKLLYEIFIDGDAGAGTNLMRFATNIDGYTANSFIQAAACGINAPTTLTGIGFPTAAWIMTVTGEELVGGGPISACGTGNPQPIPAAGTGGAGCVSPTLSPATVSATGNIGNASGDYILDSIEIQLTHTWANDLDIYLVSPGGAITVELSTDNGGSTGLDATATLVFTDASINAVTGWAGGVPLADYQAEGGLLNTLLAGLSINGDWTLRICDDAGGDSGTLLSYCINFSEITTVGDPPLIVCPADIIANNSPGTCGAVVNFSGVAIDTEDGNISGDIIATPASGSTFAVGDTTVTLSVTDSDGNTSTCEFTVTVNDNETPVAICQDITVDLDASGMATITAADVDNGSTDNCSIASYLLGIASAPTTGSLSTLYSGGNGGSNGGAVYFDLTVGPNDIDVTSIDINTGEAGTVTMNVFTLVGTSVGNETNAGAWGAADAIATGTAAGAGNPSNLILNNPITFSANTTYGIALDISSAHAFDYTNGTGCPGNQCFSNADLSMALGKASNVPFTAPVFSPRVFNGGLNYDVAAGVVPFDGTFDCSNVGENIITLTVTDASGNSSSCNSTVTIQDVTAPEVFCIGGFGSFSESEDFEGASIPSGWSTVIETGIQDWTFGSGAMPGGADFATNAAIFDDDAAGSGQVNLARLLSPVYDLTGASNVQLSFDYSVQDFVGFGTFAVEVWDGAAWQQILFVDNTDQPPLNSGNIDVSAFANAAFQVRYTYDDEGDWAWGAGVDNFLLTYEATSGGGLDVFLDANGMASIDPNDLVTGVNEACGYTITAGGGGGGTMGSLTTLFASNNGGSSGWAIMYDVTVGPADIEVTELDINADATSAFTLDLYVLTGTYVGNELNPGAWGAPAASGAGTGAGTDVPSNVVLGTPVMLSANTTYGFAVVTTGVGQSYTNGDGTNQNYSNGDLSIALGSAVSGLFTGSVFSPRIWNGAIHYTAGAGGGGLDFTCADLGENLVEVTVTDASGNVSTCTAVVNVIDNTAPVITCGPEPTVSETASDSPSLAIPDNDPTGVSSTISITDDVTIDDLNINLDVTHTWVGDLNVTITSPAGTSVMIVDRIGGTGGGVGCSGDDILATLDDAAALPIESQCGGGVPSINGTFSPNNPLSAFNGESTLGDWTITISDNAGGDTGTLNAWGITYSYANTNTDVVIELGPDGTATIDPYDIISSVVEACGIATAAVDVPTVSCADIGTPILVTVFVTDASGNLASCSANVIVVDLLAPVLTCPADQTVDPGVGNLFYILPDYIATGEATAIDNCTDPVTNTSQNPAPGTALTDGVYTITMTATDEYGNTSTCNFELTVESILGVNQNSLDAGVALYPNPAANVVNLVNKTNISLEKMMIYDINGKLVNQTNLRTMQGEKAIDVSSLAAGVYVVQIIGDNASTVKRLIKE